MLSHGTHSIELTVDDGKGETDTDEAVINVVDTTPPIITLNGENPMTIECPQVYNEPDAVVTDACDTSPIFDITGSVNSSVPGEYIITYIATDASGNSSSTARTVRVGDMTPPIITLNGENPMTIECPEVYYEPGAVVSDACDVSPLLEITGNVDSSVPGEYQITYTATDASENTSSTTRTVKVVDTVPPVISLLPPATLWPPNHKYTSLSIEDFVAGVTDGCQVSIAISDVYIASVSSDEPDDANGSGDGKTINDLVIANDCKSVQLRAERAGSGNGRVYSIKLQVYDLRGNMASASYTVEVPPSQGKKKSAVDDGPVHTVNSQCDGLLASIESENRQENYELKVSEIKISENVNPETFNLEQNYPNPFNPKTKISYQLPETNHVSLILYNSVGQQIRTLVDKQQSAGLYTVQWDGNDSSGKAVSSGVYFYTFRAGRFHEVRKALLMR